MRAAVAAAPDSHHIRNSHCNTVICARTMTLRENNTEKSINVRKIEFNRCVKMLRSVTLRLHCIDKLDWVNVLTFLRISSLLNRLKWAFKSQYKKGFQKLLLNAVHVMTKSRNGGTFYAVIREYKYFWISSTIRKLIEFSLTLDAVMLPILKFIFFYFRPTCTIHAMVKNNVNKTIMNNCACVYLRASARSYDLLNRPRRNHNNKS